MSEQSDLQENLPLTEPTFFIMLSLLAEPKHGYAIMKDVEALSQGRVKLSTGTLYGALKRLLEQGWIARGDDMERDEAMSSEGGRQRRSYALTELGKRVMNAEVNRLQSLIALAIPRSSEGLA
ncbi:MAG: helix-turn-helix transcriptional regulator [Chloroflexota bacterium]